MIYNEYWQVVDAGVKEADLVTFFYEKRRGHAGGWSLCDGAQAEGCSLCGAAMAKFLKATFKGWK